MSVSENEYSEYGGVTRFVSDIVDGTEGYAKGPERALLSALLFDGVQAYLSYMMTESARTVDANKEAFFWVNDQNKDYVFSFDCVCEALGINPEYLRLGLINVCNSNRDEWKRGRRTF